MDRDKLIAQLTEIKMSIIENADDVLWMRGGPMAGTVCEEIDGMLLDLGVSTETLESQYTRDYTNVQEDPMGSGSEPKVWP